MDGMEFKSNKILEEIHPLSIIREIQKWPVLYARDGSRRPRAHFRDKVWSEVARALFDNWDDIDDQAKEQKISDLNKKWRNLRDTFKRQLLIEKKIRAGHEIKRKTYVYFKHMLFLLPHIESSEDDYGVEPKLEEFFSKRSKRKRSQHSSICKETKCTRDIVDLAPEPSKIVEVLDADRHFFLSLIPLFQTMTEDQKLSAKVKILKIIKSIKDNRMELQDSHPEADSFDVGDEGVDLGQIKVESLHEEANEALLQRTDLDTDSSDSE